LDTTYYFSIITHDEILSNKSALSNGTTIYTPDLLPPSNVLNFKATANPIVAKRIDLSWTNPTVSDLKGVRILVSTIAYATLPTDTADVTRIDLTGSIPSGTVPIAICIQI